MHLHKLLLGYCSIACVAAEVIQTPILAGTSSPAKSLLPEDKPASPKKRLSFKDTLSGLFAPETTSLQWASGGKDGSYLETNQTTRDLWLAHVLDEERKLLVNGSHLASLLDQQNNGRHVAINGYTVQPGGSNILITANYTKLYRHSGFSDYYVYNPETSNLQTLDKHASGDIRYADYSPTGEAIAYVRGNNVYVHHNDQNVQITKDGSDDVFNGVPDWVYEEEVFASSHTFWWSPDGRFLAFLRFDDTNVPTYRIPYYMTGEKAPVYPRELELRYPKAGQPIPNVSLHVVDLDNLNNSSVRLESDKCGMGDEFLIGEVAWVTDAHSHLVWRCFNRQQDHDKLVTLELASKATTVVSERNEPHGWIDNTQSIRYVPRRNCFVYLSDEDGWSHIYMQYVNGSKPIQLTKGEWEVTKILDVSVTTIHYQSTEQHSTERHVYSLDMSFLTTTPLVNTTEPGYYSASFSKGGNYYVLSYGGPALPRQELFSLDDNKKPLRVLQNNNKLAEALSSFDLPTRSWSTLKHPDGFEMDVLETRPPNFDANKKYPLLLNPYGGPGSQSTGKLFDGIRWETYVASDPELEYVVLTVDGRGTGYRGKEFRHAVTGMLGHYEAIDQAFAAKAWSEKDYIDGNKIVIQGWSYGGYLSGKVIELDTDIFSSAIITAPVSSWLFYDAIYTERYMKLPQDNSVAYYKSSIHNSTGFSNARGFILLQHGTGDDNVHFQNSAILLDRLMTGSVSEAFNTSNSAAHLDPTANIVGGKFQHDDGLAHSLFSKNPVLADYATRMASNATGTGKPISPSKITAQFFTDADHRINFHADTLFLRKQMARALYREKRRKEVTSEEEKMEQQWMDAL